MFSIRPHAVIVDRDMESRARLAAVLRDTGFVVVACATRSGALAALAARPADLIVLNAEACDAEDALAAADCLHRCRPGCRILFAGAAAALPAAPGRHSGHAVTRPFDQRRFLSAVFELLEPAGESSARREEAEIGLMVARLACLRNRWGLPAARRISEPEGSASARPAEACGASA
jgi:DNA-binding NtrC family response regulator